MYMSIGQASLFLGVSHSTLRRWEKQGSLIPSFRTPGGHRRYGLNKLKELTGYNNSTTLDRKAIAYARVSSHDQKDDLTRQKESLIKYCEGRFHSYQVLSDLGSGIKYNKRGLQSLIHKICCGEVSHLVITFKDRLLRFGSELIFQLCELHNTEVVILGESSPKSFEAELTQDFIELVTVFSARLYGKRSAENRRRRAA